MELRSAYDVQVHFEVMDLSESNAAQRLYVASRQRGEHVDLLINNAGFGLFRPFTICPCAAIQEMLRLQVATVVRAMRLFLPGIIERSQAPLLTLSRSGRIFRTPVHGGVRGDQDVPYRVFPQALAEDRSVRCPRSERVVRAAPTRISIARPDSRPTIPWGAIRLPTLWRYSLLPYRANRVIVTMGWASDTDVAARAAGCPSMVNEIYREVAEGAATIGLHKGD